jgi:hypothetical protein
MNKTKNNKSKNAGLIKSLILMAVGASMLFLTPTIFQYVSGALASNCPSYTEYGSCELGHGLRAGAGAAGASGIWVLTAIFLLTNGLIKFVKVTR